MKQSNALNSSADISIDHSWNDLRMLTDVKLDTHEYRILREKMLDEFHRILNLFDFRWLLKRLNPEKMNAIKRNFQLEAFLKPNVFHFIDIVAKSFGKQNPVSNLCLALGAHDLFETVKAQTHRNFSYSTLVDFIMLVGGVHRERSQPSPRLSDRQQEVPPRDTLRPGKGQTAASRHGPASAQRTDQHLPLEGQGHEHRH